ncbi:hypothetical protein L914_15950 [Phytophthora nicotianae]|uniref:Peptidase S1 domain-containing protein n=2 Tax=Phytophthora nicotianae TaxID=4792 RepID=W2MMB7_PHYNI|nr:hypothetical protein L914_15950 [Phytophthora nicotianae]
MHVAQEAPFVAMVLSLSTFTYAYSFSGVSTTAETKENTGLTTNVENRIWGGSDANIDNYPFLASLRDSFFGETFCADTLIAPQYILTAAHCIWTSEVDTIATFGTNDSTGSDAGQATSIPVIEGFRHPLYNRKKHVYDVGLLKLEKPLKRKTAKLCAADGSDNEVGTMGTALGWGRTEKSGDVESAILQQVTLPIISNAECDKFKKYVGRVTEDMMCAGTGNGKDTCKGDSGGPLLVNDDILIGCVSWGSKCGQQAGIFTRLTHVMDYIEHILAGGDGSKFGVASPSDSSMEKGTLVSPTDSQRPTSNTDDLASLLKGSGAAGLSWLLELFLSSSGNNDLSWLFNSDSGSESTSTDQTKGGKTIKAPVEDPSGTASEEIGVFATKSATKEPLVAGDSEPGSDGISL